MAGRAHGFKAKSQAGKHKAKSSQEVKTAESKTKTELLAKAKIESQRKWPRENRFVWQRLSQV